MARNSKVIIAHINNLDLAAQEEAKGNLNKAASYYEESIKDEKPDELPFNRLMVIYRKQKMYKDELRVIKRGIKVFQDFYKKNSPKTAKGKKLSDLSEAFMKTSGLKDKKGELLYNPEPIGRWLKRKEVVEGKLGQGTRYKAQGTRKAQEKRDKKASQETRKK